MIDAWIEKPSYKVGEELLICMDFSSNKDLLLTASNINVDIFRVTRERNHLALGFGQLCGDKESTLTIKTKIPDSFKEGLYLVSELRLILDDEPNMPPCPISPKDHSKLFFWVSTDQNQGLSPLELTDKINEINSERTNYNNAVIVTEAAANSASATRYRVLVFGVGCLIHARQNMEGYALHPLGTGFSYKHMLGAVNSYTSARYGLQLTEVESIRSSFSSSTPLFVIDFANVKAVNQTDAGNHCSRGSENIFTLLAYDRGQRPNSFATVIIKSETGESWHGFHFPGYRGNLVSDFNPTATADTLERLLPKLDSSPWLDLIMRIYADAESEANPNYACLKFWSILEMISKREIRDNNTELRYPNGNRILDYGGNVVRTNSALGRAYQYAFKLQIPPSNVALGADTKIIFETYQDAMADPNYDEQTTVITLWDRMSALYEIRNSTAHSGKFDQVAARNGSTREKLAADLWGIEFQTFLREIGSMMRFVVSHELQKF